MVTLNLNIRARFGDFALSVDEALSLEGLTGLFGPSGSGKTTLLRIIAGLDPAQGQIAFGPEVWQSGNGHGRVPTHERGIGFVFQDTRLFRHLRVAGNLQYAERRSRRHDSRITYDEVVEALDLASLLERDAASLSGGEQQRVAIARALLSRPRLMLMDEPLAALDMARKAEILAYIERLPVAFGVPIIYVTHAIDEVARLAKTMVVLSAGEVVAKGPTRDVLERIELQAVTGRFEAGVLLSARVESHDTDYALTNLAVAGQTIVMPLLDLPVGTTVPLRVRARDVALAMHRPSKISIRNILSGTISQIIEEPDTAFAEIMIDLGGENLRSRVTRKSVAELGLAVGVPVYALVKSIAFDRRILAAEPHRSTVHTEALDA